VYYFTRLLMKKPRGRRNRQAAHQEASLERCPVEVSLEECLEELSLEGCPGVSLEVPCRGVSLGVVMVMSI
jgi:hypothetical protein